MKKYVLLISLLEISFLYGQSNLMPEPTTGSIKNYINAAISPATGVPNIGFPIYQLETSNKDFSLNLGLSYHVYNAKPNVPSSDVGLGWSLSSSGMISKEVNGVYVDEFKNWTDITEQEADIFYYSIPGHSGKFKIYKDPTSGNLIVNNLTGEKVKIEYVRETSGTKLIINSFKITDDNGFEFHFQDGNLALAKNGTVDTNYKTTFVLGKILDASGTEIVTYTYDKKTKYRGTSTIIERQTYKLNTASTSKGKIKLEYNFDSYIDNNQFAYSDPYSVKNITLLDNKERMLSMYKFVYGSTIAPGEDFTFGIPSDVMTTKVVLTQIQKLDKNLAVDEETNFDYDKNGSETQYGYYPDNSYGDFACERSNTFTNPKKFTLGLLKKVTLPTKGYIVYDFEANEYYQDFSQNDYTNSNSIVNPEVQYYMKSDVSYDTNTTRTYQIQVNGSSGTLYPVYLKNEFVEDYIETDNHGNYIPITFTVKENSTNTIKSPENFTCQDDGGLKLYKLKPGAYTITIRGGGNGFVKMYSLKSLPKPYKNEVPVKYGARVRRMQSYDADGTLTKTKQFEYNSFLNSSDSSGFTFQNENSNDVSAYNSFVLYKNVKETEISGSDNNGYIKYYFKTPADYLSPSNSYQYYNITSQGVQEKREVYNKQGLPTETQEYQYTFNEIPNTQEYTTSVGMSTPSWLQYVKETNKTYLSQSSYQTVSETTFSPQNFKESVSKTTAQDGSVSETTTKYAFEMNNTRLLNKNMISVPLQIETKSDGEIISKATTKYDNVNNFYPTSIEKTDLNQTPETQMTFDIYDNKGNLVQSTDKAGNSVTTIWGYYQTLPIAQIIGAKYNDISSLSVVTSAINASNADADNPANEGALLTALENLRLSSQLQGYPITVSTYDPLIGITNSISSNGLKQVYEYDASGRLLRVKNSSGQVLKENQYNYKH